MGAQLLDGHNACIMGFKGWCCFWLLFEQYIWMKAHADMLRNCHLSICVRLLYVCSYTTTSFLETSIKPFKFSAPNINKLFSRTVVSLSLSLNLSLFDKEITLKKHLLSLEASARSHSTRSIQCAHFVRSPIKALKWVSECRSLSRMHTHTLTQAQAQTRRRRFGHASSSTKPKCLTNRFNQVSHTFDVML